ncbi:MAG: MFS transporter [Oscillospiraceae bacterium]|nr:MFS transporter [Oscillospiraceae bacterium]
MKVIRRAPADLPPARAPGKPPRRRFLSRFLGRISGALGLSFFGFDFIKLLKMHGFFSLGTNLSGVFVGVFFIKAGSSLAAVCLFYLFCYAFEALGNVFAAGLAGKYPAAFITRAGLVFITLFYILLLAAPGFAARHYPLAAALTGIGNAMYWPPYQNYCVEYTHMGNRQKGVSLLGLLGNFIALLTPLIAGLVTSRLPGAAGYAVIFAVSVSALFVSFVVTRGMPSKPTGRKGNPVFHILLREIKDRAIASMVLMAVFYGLRDGIYLYYLNILIYTLARNEMAVGLGIAARSVVAMLAWLLLARFLPPSRRTASYFAAGLAGLFASALLRAVPALFVVLAVYVADMVFQVVSYNALQFAAYDTADYLSRSGENRRPDVIALRIFALNIGRCAGIAVFLLLPITGAAVWPLILLNALSLPGVLFARGLSSHIKKTARAG